MRGRIAAFLLLITMLAASGLQAQDAWRRTAADTLVDRIGERRMVLLGEMHGTREIPLLVGDVVERMSRSEPVLLALEIYAGEHAVLSAYMDGDGRAAERERLRQRPYWAVPQARNDGRRSEDMLDLVERMRLLRAQGRDVAILPFDVANGIARGSEWRDHAMALHLRRGWEALPHGRMLVLTGNVHAMRTKPAYAPAQMQQPMAAYLQDLAPLSFDIAAASGAFWACPSSGCGPVQVNSGMREGMYDDEGTFHHRLVLPRFTPARPVDGTFSP